MICGTTFDETVRIFICITDFVTETHTYSCLAFSKGYDRQTDKQMIYCRYTGTCSCLFCAIKNKCTHHSCSRNCKVLMNLYRRATNLHVMIYTHFIASLNLHPSKGQLSTNENETLINMMSIVTHSTEKKHNCI